MSITAGDLRAELARAGVPLYIISGRIQLHPSHLGRILNEHVPLTDAMAQKILAAIDDVALEAASR